MSIDNIINAIHPLPEASTSILKDCILETQHSKGHLLLRANRVEGNIYFIKNGVVRAYANADSNEITFWFGKEGDTVVSMKSYVANQRGYEDVELLEDCELYELNIRNLRNLFNQDIHIANWGRKLAEQELIKTEERLISLQFRTATERYQDLLKDNPDLIKRIQLKHIASYLGITQVSLSRIRAEIR